MFADCIVITGVSDSCPWPQGLLQTSLIHGILKERMHKNGLLAISFRGSANRGIILMSCWHCLTVLYSSSICRHIKMKSLANIDFSYAMLFESSLKVLRIHSILV